MKTRIFLAFILSLFATASWSQFNWQHTGGPNGGATWYIYNNDQYAFYPGEYYLYRTSDGFTWEKLPQGGLWPIATFGSTLVAQQYQGNSYYYLAPKKLLFSYDNGDNWTEVNMPPGLYGISEMALCSHGIYVPRGQENTILHSPDDGMAWDTIAAPVEYGYDVWSFDDRLYLAGGNNEIWRTDTNGQNWTNVTPPVGQGEYVRGVFAHGQHILVGTEGKLFHSHDDGQTWEYHDTPWPDFYEAFTLVGNTVYALGGPTELSRSEDFGITWTELGSPYYFSLIGLASAGGQMLGASYNQGVLSWDETTQSLTESNQGISSAAVYDLSAAENKLWAACGNGVFEYDEQQQIWNSNSPLPLQYNTYYESIATGSNGLVCTHQWLTNRFYLSNDYGTSWDTIMVEEIWNDNGYVNDISIIDDVIFVKLEYGGNVRSTDGGQTWQPLSAPFSGKILKYDSLFLGNKGNLIYASADQGLTWDILSEFPFGYLYSIFATEDRLFAVAEILAGNFGRTRVYTSEDGVSWHFAHDGLPDPHFGNDALTGGGPTLFFEYQDKYFAYNGYYGLFSSNDTCQTWFPVEPRKFDKFAQQDSLLYAGGFGGGVLRSAIPTNLYGELVKGVVFYDANNNGLQDVGEAAIPNIGVNHIAVNAWSPYQFLFTDLNGEYAMGITPGSADTLRPVVHSPHVENINPPFHLLSTGGTDKDFGIYLPSGITDHSITGNYSGRPRPGFQVSSVLTYFNLGSTEPDATVTLKLDTTLNFVSAYPAPTSVIGDSLVWEIGQIPRLNNGYISIKSDVPATTPLGTLVKSTWRIASAATDATPGNNLLVLCDTVVGSYDPNEKRVQPAEGLTEAEIAEGKELLYTIQFQNTGNYPAERVRITDMIDTALYLPSLRFVAASHPVTSFQLKPGGLLEVIFDNIMLPDSTSDEVGSHGFVTFAIQRKKAFNPTYPVRNMAAIYFDFNEPIFTNEVSFTINDTPVAVSERPGKAGKLLLIFPNPAEREFTISSNGQLHGSGTMTLQNETGQILLQRAVEDLSMPIAVQPGYLPAGIYFVQLSGGAGVMAGKIVIQADRE
jgi:uncharacterized repeat protein (TIGR01451 family)